VPDPFGVGASLSWTVICLVATLPTLAAALGARRLPRTRLDPFLAVYLLCFLAVFPFSQGRVTSAVWVVSLLANVLVFYAVAATARDAEPLMAAVLLTIVIGVSVLQLMALDFHVEQGLLSRITAYDRPEGWGGYPELGFLLCLQIGILVALLQTRRSTTWRVAIGLLLASAGIQLVFLFSRMAWVTAAALLVVSVPAGRPLGRIWKPGLAALVVALVSAGAIAQTGTGRRLLVSLAAGTASEGRLDIWRHTTRMIGDYPLAGVGAGNFQAIFEPVYNPELNNDLRRGGHAHNLWLQQAAELGLITALAYVALWCATLVEGARLSGGSWIERSAFFLVVAIAVRNMGDYMFFSTGGAQGRLHTLLWIVWGLIGAYALPGGGRRSLAAGLEAVGV
jgi:O-antigen ligase